MGPGRLEGLPRWLGWTLAIAGGIVFVPLTALFLFLGPFDYVEASAPQIPVHLVGLVSFVVGGRILKATWGRMLLIVVLIIVAFYIVAGALLMYGMSQFEY
jgi:hypothetical protein